MTHILIVDDDAHFCRMLEKMAGREGYLVSTAGNGNEALQAISAQPPDLIITDILMPEKDGIELILELAQRGDRTPVIAISGGRRAISKEFNLESAKLIGVRATLAKPVTREALRQTIDHALAN